MEDMQKMLDEVGKFSKDIKLKFEVDKSKIMIVNREMKKDEVRKGELLGIALDFADEYKYLGLMIDKIGLGKEKNGIRKKAEKNVWNNSRENKL